MARSTISTSRQIVMALAVCSVVPLLAGCPKKKEEPPVVQTAPPPPTETAPTALVPMEEEDAGEVDAGSDAGKPKATGPAVNANVARLKQCCTALGNEAKKLGSTPEAGMFTTAATQCSAMVTQFGASGTAPELGVLRGLLAGRSIPAVCAGF